MSHSPASSVDANHPAPSPMSISEESAVSPSTVPRRSKSQPSPVLSKHPRPGGSGVHKDVCHPSARRAESPSSNADQQPVYCPPSIQSQIDAGLLSAVRDDDDLPTRTDCDNADENTLRGLAKELLITVQKSRISASYYKLQGSLHLLASKGTVEDKKAEQQLATGQASFDHAFQHAAEVEKSNVQLKRALEEASEALEEESAKLESLAQDNKRLKDRIRCNRAHFNLLMHDWKRSHTCHSCAEPLRPVSLHTPHTPPRKRKLSYPHEIPRDPIATLLAADQMLSEDQRDIPLTPPSNLSRRLSSPRYRPRRVSTCCYSTHRVTEREHVARDKERTSERDSYDSDATLLASDVEETDDDHEKVADISRVIPFVEPPLHLLQSPEEARPGEQHQHQQLPNRGLRQQRLFGQVRKHNTATAIVQSGRSAKRTRTGMEESIER